MRDRGWDHRASGLDVTKRNQTPTDAKKMDRTTLKIPQKSAAFGDRRRGGLPIVAYRCRMPCCIPRYAMITATISKNIQPRIGPAAGGHSWISHGNMGI